MCGENDSLIVASLKWDKTNLQGILSDVRHQVRFLSDECSSLTENLEEKAEEVQSLQAHIRNIQV